MPKTILVVDDDLYMHRLLKHHLERNGFAMISAHNGREAVETALSAQPALIIMDVMMGEMDGLTALKNLKKEDTTKGIPVIMITANAHYITRQESETSGSTLFLTKPFSPTQLLAQIRELITEPNENK